MARDLPWNLPNTTRCHSSVGFGDGMLYLAISSIIAEEKDIAAYVGEVDFSRLRRETFSGVGILHTKIMHSLKPRIFSPQEIYTSPPGKDLNALIAINVGKWQRKAIRSSAWYTNDGIKIADVFEPSSSLDDCFKVCRETSWHIYLDRQTDGLAGAERWTASVIVARPIWTHQIAMANTGPLAVSRALLLTALALGSGNSLFEEDPKENH
jgi:hypothetical protein